MRAPLGRRLHHLLECHLPEQRLFLRGEDGTRFLRLRSSTQALAIVGGAALLLWSSVATALVLINLVTAGSDRERLEVEGTQYERRLGALAEERDRLATDLREARERYAVALEQVSAQQTLLLKSEDRRREQEAGLRAVRNALGTTIRERDAALRRTEALIAEAESGTDEPEVAGRYRELRRTLDFMSLALADTAGERDGMGESTEALKARIADLELAARIERERGERIFKRLEEAVSVSMAPLDRMFQKLGIPADKIIADVRKGYTGAGGPLNPIAKSTRGTGADDPLTDRFNELIEDLDRIDGYRRAIDSVPLALPVQSAFRFTSRYGMRRHPISGARDFHDGSDLAAPGGTPIHATGDGEVVFAGWQGGYGRLVKIRHAHGLETRYAHLRRIAVSTGQRVSRGDRIGDMGSSGSATGTHLHYEVRRHGKAVNPMTYIEAARDVF